LPGGIWGYGRPMTLEQRIADRLHWTLDRLAATGRMLPAAERGLCVDGTDAPTVVLTVEEAARIIAVAINEDGLPEVSDSNLRRFE
jgi:hypothetical protein